MPKEPKKSMYNKLNVKDILVIVLSIVALVILVLVVKHSNEEAQRLREELNQISSNVQEGGLAYEEEDALSHLQFSEIGQEGFVEFTNTGNRNVEVGGYKLVVNGEEEVVLAEGTIIAPDEYLVIAMKEAFAIDAEVTVCLYDAKGNLIKHVESPAIKEGYSYSLLSTTNLEYGILETTRGQWNGYLLMQDYEELTFSVPSGCYNDDFYLSLYAPEGSTVYYTLDGTIPTVKSEKYTEPLLIANRSGSDVVYAAQASAGNGTFLPVSITKATVVRAICVEKGGRVSDVVTHTYLMGLRKATDLQNISIMSITIEPEDMFDYFDGMYVRGRSYDDALAMGESTSQAGNYLNGWVKDATIEYFEPCKDRSFVGDVKIQVTSDDTVHSSQKSFVMSEITGIEDEITSLQTYCGNDGTIVLQSNKSDNSYKVREYIGAEVLKGSAIGVPELSPCAVFVDGEYWGCYMLRRPYDASYIADNYQVKEEDVQLVVNGESSEEDAKEDIDALRYYVITTDMSVEENYAKVAEQMDMQSFAEYICANLYLANSRFEPNTWMIWRDNGGSSEYSDGRWRWLMPEMDNSMDNGMTSKLTGSAIDSFLTPAFSKNYFIQSLLRNDTFCSLVQDTMEEMMTERFAYETVEPLVNGVSAKMNKPAMSSYKRFIGYPSETFFVAEIEKIKSFFMERPTYMSVYVKELKDIRGQFVEQLPLVIEEEQELEE